MSGFLEPENLLLLPPLITVFIIIFKYRKARHLKRILSTFETYSVFLNNSTFSPRREIIHQWLCIGIISFLILSLAQPYFGYRKDKTIAPAEHVIILLDMSASMSSKEDEITRSQRATSLLREISSLNTEAQFSLYSFTEKTYRECQPTYDMYTFMEAVYDAQESGVPQSGSNLAQALQHIFKESRNSVHEDKRIIILSDGEFHNGKSSKEFDYLKEQRIPFYFVGIGSKQSVIQTATGPVISEPTHHKLATLIQNTGGRYKALTNPLDTGLHLYNWITKQSQSLFPHEQGLTPNESSGAINTTAFLLFLAFAFMPLARAKETALKYMPLVLIFFIIGASPQSESTVNLTKQIKALSIKINNPSKALSHAEIVQIKLRALQLSEELKALAPKHSTTAWLGKPIQDMTQLEKEIKRLQPALSSINNSEIPHLDYKKPTDQLSLILFDEKKERLHQKDTYRRKQGIKQVAKPW